MQKKIHIETMIIDFLHMTRQTRLHKEQRQPVINTEVLKVPKREIFVTELIILSHPIWIGDLRTKAKNRFVRIVRLLFAILFFFC